MSRNADWIARDLAVLWHPCTQMAEHPDLVSFCTETLGALTHYDKEQNSNLVETLEAFFAHHGNLSQTAEALFIHRNTLQYRMDRIAEIASARGESAKASTCAACRPARSANACGRRWRAWT